MKYFFFIPVDVVIYKFVEPSFSTSHKRKSHDLADVVKCYNYILKQRILRYLLEINK